MELCSGGELFEKISLLGHFNERAAAKLFKQMMFALNYCYTKKICHKDLKPENFLFLNNDTESCLKLIDFGLSQIFANPSKKYKANLNLEIGKIKMKDKVGSVLYCHNCFSRIMLLPRL